MSHYNIIKIQTNSKWKMAAAQWFHEKWGIPLEDYIQSMDNCLEKKRAIPQWYIVLDEDNIIAGLGVIENDFHDRKDLSPNVCAVYVEEEYRCQGIAGEMLSFVCQDMKRAGLDILYLLTDHTAFYERYGWEFFCMAQGNGESSRSRVYIHRTS